MQYILSVLPLLLCPIAMGVMMWVMMRSMGMSGNQGQSNGQTSGQAMPMSMMHSDPPATNTILVSSDTPTEDHSSEDVQIAELRAQLARAQAQLKALERDQGALMRQSQA